MPTVLDGPLPSNTMVQGLLWDGWKWVNDTVVYYYFNSAGTDSGIQGWAPSEKDSYRAAAAAYSAVANIGFQEVFTRASANFIENIGSPAQLASLNAATGWHDSPFDARVAHTVNLGAGQIPSYAVNQAAGFYNYLVSGSHWGNDLAIGSKTYQTFMHEIGHGLGLKHPWASIGSSPQFPGVTAPGVMGSNNLAHTVYTIMSYSGNMTFDANGIIQLNANTIINGNIWNYGYNKTLGAFDIAAIQFLYGANNTTNTGNNSYLLPDVNAVGTGWETIWDAGGTDEIYYDGSRNVIIDLIAATLDNTATGGGVLSYAANIYGGFTIANGVVIEKATGGSGADTLSGNDAANFINGRGGADVLRGRGGGDTFVLDNWAYAALDRVLDYDQFGGDRVDVSALVGHSYFSQSNASLVRAIASEDNAFTTLQVDTDGIANGPNWATVARLDNVQQGHLVRAVLHSNGSYADFTVIRAPIITSGGGGSSATVSLSENTTYVSTIQATNYSSGSSSFSLSGGQAHLFSIDGSGNIFFRTAPNYENPSERSLSFDANVTDSNGLTDTQTVFVNVTNVQEAPVFSNGSTATVSVQENRTSVMTVGATDPEGASVTYSLVGGVDRSFFNITSGGQLTFLSARDFENPADGDRNNSYVVQVRATDAAGSSSDQLLTVNVTNVSDSTPPRFTSHGGAATANVNISENTTAVTTLTATDDDGTVPTLSIVTGLDSAFFTLVNGVLSFIAPQNHEAPADANRDNFYEVVVRASDGSLFADQKIFAVVNDVNEAPVIVTNGGGATATVFLQENVSSVTTVSGTDPEGVGLIYSIVGGADAARFGVGVFNGILTFNSAPDYELPSDSDRNNTYTVIVRASDGSFSDDQTITINVTQAAEAPVITSWGGGPSGSFAVASGAQMAGTVTSYDGDGTTPTYAIAGGADAAKFEINATTGILSFKAAPNVVAPTDANQDNSYLVTVLATDGVLSGQQTLRIHVTRGSGPLIEGTSGDDSRIGTAGNDDINGLAGNDILSGGGGDDALNGGDGGDSLHGQDGADLMFGGWGDDALFGGTGNDLMTGGVGNDGIDGGADVDAALWSGGRSSYLVRSFVSGGQFYTQMTAASGTEGTDVLVNVEVLGFNSGGQAFGLAGIQQNLVSNIDGSIYDDVLFQNTATGQIAYVNMTSGTSGGFANVLGSLPAGWRLVGTEDFTGDGRADALVQDTSTGSIFTVNIASGSPVWGTVNTLLTSAYQAIASGDVTRDGTADVLVRDTATGQTFIADMEAGGTFGNWVLGPNLGTGWRTVGLGDFNRDGASDVLVQNNADGMTYYRDIASGQWGFVSGAVGSQWVARESADLNGDGYCDVVFQNGATGDIWWANMLGGSNAGWGVVANGLSGWDVRGSADVDNDGYRDVIIQNTSNGTTYYADMNNGTFGGFGAVSGALGTQWLAVG